MLSRTLRASCQQIGGLSLCIYHLAGAARQRRCDPFELLRAVYLFGWGSLPLTVLTAIFMGITLVLQSASYVQQYGAQELIGYFAGYSVLRELGPVVLGLMLSGRVGANNTAELATLQATERLGALQVLQVDLYGWLLLPRTLAMMVSQLVLLMVANVTSLLTGAAAARLMLGVRPGVFYKSCVDGLGSGDLLVGSGKALAFGFLVAVISSYCGCAYRGAATQVGQAVRRQVVACAVSLFALDYGLSVCTQGF